ncbi:MAG: hypothetical protein C5B57_09645, partial [Blastocatellia bacterium]
MIVPPNCSQRIGSVAAILVVVSGLIHPSHVAAQDARRLDLSSLSTGASAFPLVWKPYRPTPITPLNLRNSTLLDQQIAAGKLAVSARDFLQLVVENNLDLQAARYDYAIAQVDVLRARSGQAARGTSSSPLPAALFAGALGAGVSANAALSAGGTGGAAITTQGRLVAIGPRGNFDPTLSANLSYDRLVNPLNTKIVAGAAKVVIPSTVLQTRFQQQLPYGTSYSVSFNLQRQASTQSGLLFDPALTSFWSLQVYQPLLNGFGLALTRRFITLAENNRTIVREAFHGTLNDTLANAANAYWDLVALRENVRVAEEAVSAAQRQVDENQQRADLGVMTPLDVLSAESQLASARVQLVVAQTKEQQQEVTLKTLITMTADPRLDSITIEPIDPLPSADYMDIPALSVSTAAALANRSSIRQAQLALQNQRIADEYTRKNLLPTLSVFGAVNLYGLAPATSPALRQMVRWSYPEYSIGFTWSLPVLNRAAQADDVRARFETQQAEAALHRTESQIVSQVQAAIVGLQQSRARVEAAERAVEAGRRAYEGERVKLTEGISTPYRVLLAQRDLTAAESAD